MFQWRRLAPGAPFGGAVALYVLYRQVYDTAGIDAVDLSIPQEAWQSLTGPQAAVADLGARLSWGIAVLAFSLAFLAVLTICLRVTWTASAGRGRVRFDGQDCWGGDPPLQGLGLAPGSTSDPSRRRPFTLPGVCSLFARGHPACQPCPTPPL